MFEFIFGIVMGIILTCYIWYDYCYGDKSFQKNNKRIIMKNFRCDVSNEDCYTLRIEHGEIVTSCEDSIKEEIEKSESSDIIFNNKEINLEV